jgi:hypothetical protein
MVYMGFSVSLQEPLNRPIKDVPGDPWEQKCSIEEDQIR